MSRAVVDLSPGSGALAEACMKMGAQYFGVVFDKTHFQWLSNVVDRASLQYICAQGGLLYHADLAAHVSADTYAMSEAATTATVFMRARAR